MIVSPVMDEIPDSFPNALFLIFIYRFSQVKIIFNGYIFIGVDIFQDGAAMGALDQPSGFPGLQDRGGWTVC